MDPIFVLRLHVFERCIEEKEGKEEERGEVSLIPPSMVSRSRSFAKKYYGEGGGKRVSSRRTRGYSRFSPRKFGSVYTSIELCALETRARVCSTRDTVTTYKGLVQAKRITYAFWIRDRPRPDVLHSLVRGTKRNELYSKCIVRTLLYSLSNNRFEIVDYFS